jgi:diaminohydroxyphosphoribosylaminopyrimidine deaminase / 5-amino-6-(5-phosphoribosylamino)uracil reductase
MDNSTFDTQMMVRALQLARKGRYWANPNPHVGCVLAQDGHVIGEGFTQPAGKNHAEIEALSSLSRGEATDPRGATAYVTLEPCSHQGKTGPCADALIEAGISRVVVAMRDPNPEVAGKGLEKLASAGVEVECGVLEAEAQQLIRGFVLRHTRGRGRVRLKLAMSMDGRTAMASGESQWITGADARRDVHRLRAGSCAVVTGIGTVLADNCSLTARELAEEGMHIRQPLRVVLDSQLRTPPGAKVLDDSASTLLCHAHDKAAPVALESVDSLPLDSSSGGLDLAQLMGELSQRQCNEILVESGPRLAGAMIGAGLVDELVIYMAASFLGSSARPLFELPIETMADKVQLEIQDARRVGADWRFTATIATQTATPA